MLPDAQFTRKSVMSRLRRFLVGSALAVSGLLISSCAIKDLKDDLDHVQEDYGYLKGSASGPDDGSAILVGLFRNQPDGMSIVKVRSVNPGEPFYMLVPKADYTLLAFSDTNGDFAYQSGEPAARIDDPTVNWFSTMEGKDRVDYTTLAIQQIELAGATVLNQHLDFSLSALRENSDTARNFLRIVSWDDDAFSAENMELGMWKPGAFQEKIGYGLYVLEEIDPTRKTILLVHGINDTPRIFEIFANAIPDDYQLLLFHYPSAFPLEYTSYVLIEALDELIRRYQIPQLDVVAHSMGGLVSKGMFYQADEELLQRTRLFITMASPFGGHSAAAAGLKWSPVIAPVWWAMAPGSDYLQLIDSVDLTQGPNHHLIYSYSHEAGGEREEDDGVVTVESQLIESAQRNAVATYGVADNHVGVVTNPCTLALVPAILQDGAGQVAVPEC
jgi:pimeloyl-ACP methyl ester carboxylesterase